ncbi:hypothetical protein Ddc_07651 [Ditylenchus destructor]|nr:hypothetical protein Ddc_07651 [Ditylenchus destructor]
MCRFINLPMIYKRAKVLQEQRKINTKAAFVRDCFCKWKVRHLSRSGRKRQLVENDSKAWRALQPVKSTPARPNFGGEGADIFASRLAATFTAEYSMERQKAGVLTARVLTQQSNNLSK